MGIFEKRKKFIITQEMVESFGDLCGDKNPVHFDEISAREMGFNGKICHGILVSSFFSNMIANDLPGPGSIYLKQDLKFLKPCYVGKEIEILLTLQKREGNKFFLKTQAFGIDGEILIDGEAVVLNKKNV